MKHDLSFDATKLDFQALLKTAGIAYGNTRCKVEEYLSELQHLLGTEDYKHSKFPLNAEWLAEAAAQLAVAASTYHTLLNALDRSQLEVINKPDVKEVA